MFGIEIDNVGARQSAQPVGWTTSFHAGWLAPGLGLPRTVVFGEPDVGVLPSKDWG